MNFYDILLAEKLGGGTTPTGEISITENGIYDVTQYASADVNVSAEGISADDIAMRTISGVMSGSASYIASSAFWRCPIEKASFPEATKINAGAFFECSQLAEIYFPKATSIGFACFSACSALTTIDLPFCNRMENNAFTHCKSLSSVRLPVLSSLGGAVFQSCSALMTVIILASSVPSIVNWNAFGSTPMLSSGYTGSFGSIYVPASLVDSYKTASVWSVFKDRITAYEG